MQLRLTLTINLQTSALPRCVVKSLLDDTQYSLHVFFMNSLQANSKSGIFSARIRTTTKRQMFRNLFQYVKMEEGHEREEKMRKRDTSDHLKNMGTSISN